MIYRTSSRCTDNCHYIDHQTRTGTVARSCPARIGHRLGIRSQLQQESHATRLLKGIRWIGKREHLPSLPELTALVDAMIDEKEALAFLLAAHALAVIVTARSAAIVRSAGAVTASHAVLYRQHNTVIKGTEETMGGHEG